MIRVLIAGDHPMTRSGLTQLLDAAGGIRVIAVAENGWEAIELDAEHLPDVVLMDISMPELDGVQATRRIVDNRPDAHVVILTSFPERVRIFAALDAGAVGYLLKDAEPDEIVRGVMAGALGQAPFSPRAAQALVDRRREPRSEPILTSRERQVLALVGAGLSNKHIARQLDISEKTVKALLTNVFAALGITDRAHAALWAQRKGLAPAAE